MKQKLINKRIYFRMKMKFENALTIALTSLFLISFNAFSAEVSNEVAACNNSINKGDAKMALTQSEAILEKNDKDYEGLICKGRALGLQGKYSEALAAMELAVNSTDDSFAQTISYILIGNLHKANQKTAEAIASYQKSLEICAKDNNQTYTRINHNLIGEVHTEAKDLNAALDSYLLSVRLANNDNERADSFERLAATYNALGNHDKAIEYQVKAVVMQKKAGTLTAYADASLALGKYFFDAESYSNAVRTYKKLAKFAQDNGGAYYEAKANFHMAETMFANGDKDEAKALFVGANNLANKIGAKALASEINAVQKKLNI
jgi:tetratricopeptide (TPR) repeat protein